MAMARTLVVVPRRPHEAAPRGQIRVHLGEQPSLNRGGCPLSLRIIMGETAGAARSRTARRRGS